MNKVGRILISFVILAISASNCTIKLIIRNMQNRLNLKKYLIRMYDFHYMVRIYSKRGNATYDFALQLLISNITWFVIFVLIKSFFTIIAPISYKLFLVEYIICFIATSFFLWRFEYKVYVKDGRQHILNKLWHNKSKKINTLLFSFEFIVLNMMSLLIFCFIVSLYCKLRE